MIKLLHILFFKYSKFTGPFYRGPCSYAAVPANLGAAQNIQLNNKLKSNKLIN
jgi:hypothetical protein